MLKTSLLFAAATALFAQVPPANIVAAAPGSVLFAQTLIGGSAAAQTVAIAMAGSTTGLTYTATVSTNWLTVTPAMGTVPGLLSVSVNPAGLAVGSNTGTITVSLSGTTTAQLMIPVTYVLTPSPALVAGTNTLSLGMGFGNPGGGMPNVAFASGFQVSSTAGVSPFTASITNTCAGGFSVAPASGTTPATVTVSGDLTVLFGGMNCTATVTLISAGLPSIAIPVTAVLPTGGGLPPTGGMGATPTVTRILNAASYVEGAVSPGEIVTVFGSNLGPATLISGTVTNGTLSTTLGTMQVTFGGSAAPIVYARSDQMSVVVPFDAGSGLVNMQILTNGQTASTTQVVVVSATPGIFTTASTGAGQGAIVNQDGTINGLNNAAARGSIVSLYLTGAGALTPAGASGALASTTQLQKVVDQVAVTIGGQPATVGFAGAVPGSLLGLYQVNATVPSAAMVGNAAVQVSVGAAASQTGVTINVK